VGSPLRVLHVVVNMNRGGAETLLMNLYRNIDRSKIQFDFLTCKEGVFDKEILEMGGKVYRIPYITDVGHKQYRKALDEFFRVHRSYKVVHSHMDKMSGLVLKSAKKFNIPIRIAHSHNTKSEGGLVARTYKWLIGTFINSNATHRYACSSTAAKWLFGKRADAATLLKNGIDVKQFSFSNVIRNQLRKELQVDENTIIFGHVGRFNHQKNHLFLLEIFSEINKILPNTILLLVGDGHLRSSIESKIKDLDLRGKVKLLGVREDVSNLIQSFDMFVFPSLHEGLPVTLIEAQGAGLPCIISDTITIEVDMGLGLVQYVTLSDKRLWVEKVVEVASLNMNRNLPENALSKKGYDIRNTAQLVQNSYLSLGG
jgi:glycosyltransferase involved in cell wall biosynthesis